MQHISLSVPAEAAFARTVRMVAANLAVVQELDVDTVEDVRMVAEEGFIYACATKPAACEVSFDLHDDEMRIAFSLGDADLDEAGDGADLDLVELLLSSVCDEFYVSDDGGELCLAKKVGAHAE